MMKRLVVIIAAVMALSGCATNGQFDAKKTALLVGGIIVIGAISANQSDSREAARDCYIVVTNQGSSQVCR